MDAILHGKLLLLNLHDGAWAQGYDVMEEMYNTKTAAMNFVHEVCKVRAKGNLADFMTICIGVMNEYKVAHLSNNLPWPAGATHLGTIALKAIATPRQLLLPRLSVLRTVLLAHRLLAPTQPKSSRGEWMGRSWLSAR